MKKLLSLGLVALLSACSTVATNQVPNQNVTKLDAVSTSQLLNNQSNAKQQVFLAEVSKNKGASFSVNVDISSGFNVKATLGNVNGVAAKGTGNIAKVDVYLLSLPSGFSGTNPLGVSSLNVVKSFTGASALAESGSPFTITFQGVPGLATNQYWVGLVAKDSTGAIINKPPATAWTLDTAAVPALSLSSSGVGVDTTTLAVSTTTALTLSLNLLDAVGAQIQATTSSTAGTNTLSGSTVTAS